jgi:hypothetical protein
MKSENYKNGDSVVFIGDLKYSIQILDANGNQSCAHNGITIPKGTMATIFSLDREDLITLKLEVVNLYAIGQFGHFSTMYVQVKKSDAHRYIAKNVLAPDELSVGDEVLFVDEYLKDYGSTSFKVPVGTIGNINAKASFGLLVSVSAIDCGALSTVDTNIILPFDLCGKYLTKNN